MYMFIGGDKISENHEPSRQLGQQDPGVVNGVGQSTAGQAGSWQVTLPPLQVHCRQLSGENV